MNTRIHLLVGLFLVLFQVKLHAQGVVASRPLPRYPEIKTQFNRQLSQSLTNQERLDLYCRTVSQGRFSGKPMVMRMFGNFHAGSFNLDPSIPGLSETVRLLASDNRNVVIGNARTLRYALSIQADSRFEVDGLNRLRVTSAGKTDADLVFRHQPTGLRLRMEVKNMTPASQRSNLGDLQTQIMKMAEDARMTGEIQVWANRQNVIPEVRAFAERHGVKVEERLRTGNTNLLPGDRKFQDFANQLDKDLRFQARCTVLTGSVKAGMGAYLAYQAMGQLEGDYSSFEGTKGDWLRIGEHGSSLVAGGGFTIAGVAQLARGIPLLANHARLVSATRWGGRLGIAGVVLAEGFVVGQYLNGHMTERQFWRIQTRLGGGLAGGVGGGFTGYWIGGGLGAGFGAVIGSVIPGPGTAAGASVGFAWGSSIGGIAMGIGGSYAGSHLAGRGIDNIYLMKDTEHKEKYAQFLLGQYQLH
ncbi:MAG: hypothetical protein ACKO23_21705 [Gemmataceae bacterium]